MAVNTFSDQAKPNFAWFLCATSGFITSNKLLRTVPIITFVLLLLNTLIFTGETALKRNKSRYYTAPKEQRAKHVIINQTNLSTLSKDPYSNP